MLASLFLKGSLIGFSIAMPVGPVGMVCIQHSLRRGMIAGIVAGLGAALADALYGCMAGFGISLLSHNLVNYQILFQIVGAVILCYLGIKIFNSSSIVVENTSLSFSCRKIFLSTFILTLTNPLTLVCFAASYAGFGIAITEQEILPTAILTLGVWLGATIWWFILSCGVTLISRKLKIHSSPIFNRISGVILTSFGLLAALLALQQLLLIFYL